VTGNSRPATWSAALIMTSARSGRLTQSGIRLRIVTAFLIAS